MTDLRSLHEVEKLLQESVFQPSPCRQLRERVLRDAAQAKQRQKLWQRFLVVSSTISGSLVAAFVVVRLCTQGPAIVPEPGPVRVQVYSPGRSREPEAPMPRVTAPATSLGADLYLGHADPQNDVSPAPARSRNVRLEQTDR
jgi:hypothetical protein